MSYLFCMRLVAYLFVCFGYHADNFSISVFREANAHVIRNMRIDFHSSMDYMRSVSNMRDFQYFSWLYSHLLRVGWKYALEYKKFVPVWSSRLRICAYFQNSTHSTYPYTIGIKIRSFFRIVWVFEKAFSKLTSVHQDTENILFNSFNTTFVHRVHTFYLIIS